MRDCGNCIYQHTCRQQRCMAGHPTPWYESPGEIAAGLAWGRRKAQLVHWLKRHMGDALSRRQRRVLDMYLFRGMTCNEIARATGTNRATVYRSMRRSVARLQQLWAQAEDKPKPPEPEIR